VRYTTRTGSNMNHLGTVYSVFTYERITRGSHAAGQVTRVPNRVLLHWFCRLRWKVGPTVLSTSASGFRLSAFGLL
jgi:hypothetical protein